MAKKTPEESAEGAALHIADFARANTKAAIALAWEAVNYRAWVCPDHGDVRRNVNAIGLCLYAATTEDKKLTLCKLQCERTGDLMTPVDKLVRNAAFLAETGVVSALVERREGLRKNAKTENHVHFQQINVSLEELSQLPAPIRDRLIREQLVLVDRSGGAT